jgi:hypothetical protein
VNIAKHIPLHIHSKATFLTAELDTHAHTPHLHRMETEKHYRTGLFSYEKSSNFLGGRSTLERSHNVIPLPARRIVGIHPVKIVLHKNDY